MPAANATQKPTAIASRCSRERIDEAAGDDDHERERHPGRHRRPPEVERVGAVLAEQQEAEHEPEVRRVEDVASAEPDHVLREERRPPRSPAKIHQPRRLHQSPCSVPGTRRTKATPLPVRSALAGHMITRCRRSAIAELEHRAGRERDEDLRDREPEVERDLARAPAARRSPRRGAAAGRAASAAGRDTACRGSAASACRRRRSRARSSRPMVVRRGSGA